MPDLKLLPLLEAAQPERLQARLAPFFGPAAGPVRLVAARLQAPVCYWAVYQQGRERVTLKSFFAAADFAQYAEQLASLYPERLDRPDHPCGGLLLAPELNGVIWRVPFDPALLGLDRCLDGAWVARALGGAAERLLDVRLLRYNPEVGALCAYRDRARGRLVAYGKVTAEETCGLVYAVLRRLGLTPARRLGRLRIPRPLAFRADVGLLLQTPVPGRPLGRDRNRRRFLQLCRAAGSALAAVHGSGVPFGRPRRLDDLLARLESTLPELPFVAPQLYDRLRRLASQLAARAARTRPGPLVPSHGDFKWDQLLERGGRFSLIDFELFCQAEPEYDAGSFCAYLPPSRPRDWAEAAAPALLRAAFLRAYRRASGRVLRMERLALYEAAALAVRALAHVWHHQPGWELRAAQLLDLAFERLVSAEGGG